MNKDLQFITTPMQWPQWPILPLKHRTKRDGAMPVCGVIFDTGKPIVFESNMFSLGNEVDVCMVPQHSYPTYEALAEEWEVD